MTVQEAISIIKSIRKEYEKKKFGIEAIDISIQSMEEVEQYRALGTVEELKEAREKQVAKRPIEQLSLDGALKGGKCPTCGRWINNGRHWMYCECQQKLDWSEEDD